MDAFFPGQGIDHQIRMDAFNAINKMDFFTLRGLPLLKQFFHLRRIVPLPCAEVGYDIQNSPFIFCFAEYLTNGAQGFRRPGGGLRNLDFLQRLAQFFPEIDVYAAVNQIVLRRAMPLPVM